MYWYWQNIIPSKFHKNSGLLEYGFLVSNFWHKEFNFIKVANGKAEKIPKSAYCETIIDDKKYYLLVSDEVDPNLYQSLLLMGKTFFSGDRIHRYLNLYKAYECLCTKPNPVLKSIRNGLSHPSSVLNNVKTKNNLISIFGSTLIDISKFKHERLFFTYLGKLFMENDIILFERVKSKLNILRQLENENYALHDWQVINKK